MHGSRTQHLLVLIKFAIALSSNEAHIYQQLGVFISSNLVEVRLIHQSLRRNWEVYLRHTPRTFNVVADTMIKQKNLNDLRLHIYREPPASVISHVQRDICNTNLSMI